MTDNALPSIEQRLQVFLRRELGPDSNRGSMIALLGDASTRRYFRYISDKKASYILTAYPEPFEPENSTYLQMYRLFTEIGVAVPEVLAVSGDLGVVLQEDLGNETLLKRLEFADGEERTLLIRRAIDYLVRLQQQGTAALKPDYEAAHLALDQDRLSWELGFFKAHFLRGFRDRGLSQELNLDQEFSALVSELERSRRLLCHRDYQVRNLMFKQDRLYVIDFQDARMGPHSYDLVSLLKDSIQLKIEEVRSHVDYYLSEVGNAGDRQVFYREFELMSIQRLLKALGTYGYQISVRGRSELYAPLVMGSLERVYLSLQAVSAFPYIRSMVERELRFS